MKPISGGAAPERGEGFRPGGGGDAPAEEWESG